ncbi:DUF3961 domain-containing protein [Bacillus sp. NA_165.1]
MFGKMNEYFGLESLADRSWYYGVFIIGSLLFLIDMFVAHIL